MKRGLPPTDPPRAATLSSTPSVAIVGRPNVGKSTLFNRLAGRRQAIVHDQPGATRDRIAARVEILDGRPVELIDTGGLVTVDDELGLGRQVLAAVAEADILVVVMDGREGLTPADRHVWQTLRSLGKPAVLAVNKSDTRDARANEPEFWALGIDPVILISAEHGLGIGELCEALGRRLPETVVEEEPSAPAIAIVGRPNVGKSSLLNRILGTDRVLVSPVPGTTRDPVDTLIRRGDREYLLIDTAGIRRRSRTSGAPEELAVMMARRQIERARLAVLVVDAADGVTTGDLSVAGAIWEMGRPAVVAINKWDLLDDDGRVALESSWERLAEVLSSPPRVNLSALTGRAVEKLFPALDAQLAVVGEKLSTAEVNRILAHAVERYHPPTTRPGRPWKLLYATQVSTLPPTFMLFANATLSRGDTYRRYLENQMRAALGWAGVPIRLVVRKRGE